MKKFFYSMVALLMIVATATMFTSCNDDEKEESAMRFTLAMERNAYLGTETEAETAYMLQIAKAYQQALGMDDYEVIVQKGDFKKKCDEMKKKFDGASLPSAPAISGTYTIIFSLYGELISSDDLKREKLSTKTFTNE